MKYIKIVLADDNVNFCKLLSNFLEKQEEIKIVGIANNDEEEIRMIEELKPDIVITDLMRNGEYTGLDIIKGYKDRKQSPHFLVISADFKTDILDKDLKVAGYLTKPINDFNRIYEDLKRIRREIIDTEYNEWNKKYHNVEIYDLKKYFNLKDKRVFKKLGIKIYNKKYTEYEFERLTMDLLAYYDELDMELSEEERQFQKSLKDAKVSRDNFNRLVEKIELIKKEKKFPTKFDKIKHKNPV